MSTCVGKVFAADQGQPVDLEARLGELSETYEERFAQFTEMYEKRFARMTEMYEQRFEDLESQLQKNVKMCK